jgi:hypothetical protein
MPDQRRGKRARDALPADALVGLKKGSGGERRRNSVSQRLMGGSMRESMGESMRERRESRVEPVA